MVQILNLYLDDSGTRHPDKKVVNLPAHGNDWFSLGGVLINQEDEDVARHSISQFKSNWPQIGDSPLHSVEIRNKTHNFRWLMSLSKQQEGEFFSELSDLLLKLPVLGIACVIDRKGYNDRFAPLYGRQRWSLCKTAFSILVERSAKHAIKTGYKLRVMPERCAKKEDAKLKSYYEDIKLSGHPFDKGNAAKYAPLSEQSFSDTLYEFRLKMKSSPLMQIADLYLWAISIGGYHPANKSFSFLEKNQKLIDSKYPEELDQMGIKYYCFNFKDVLEKQKPV